jgi:16S rRNA (cytosine1402-N4)-methyltransferase
MTTRRAEPSAMASPRGMTRHVPVLLAPVLTALAPARNESFIDGTFGAGGYTRALLSRANTRVLAIDRDPFAIAGGASLKVEFKDRLVLVEGRFGDMERLARATSFDAVDGVVLDVGVSSMQLDIANRGFSFQADGPLDMRMSATGPNAADVVNALSEDELADIFFFLGEEKRARAIARAIAKSRAAKPISRTLELADLCARVLRARKIDQRHAATRVFQALRIFINDELGELALALSAAERLLKSGGRLAVVTFHSLEDGLVKNFLRQRTGRGAKVSRHLPQSTGSELVPSFRFVNHQPVSPSREEIDANPRARSARLRFAVRTNAPAWPPMAIDPAIPRLSN